MSKLTDWFHTTTAGGEAAPDDAGSRSLEAPLTQSREAFGSWQFAARIALSIALLGAGVYMLSNYLRALIWALVLAIALWPLFQRTAVRVPAKLRKEVLPALFVLAVALIFVVPFVVLGVEAVREAHNALDYGKQAEQNGIPVPEVVSRLPPRAAAPITDWWNANLAHSGWAKDYADKIDTASNRELGRNVGKDAIHRVVLFGFALLALFFLFRDGDTIMRQSRSASHRLFGPRGEKIGRQMVASVHGTVNGLVLVGLGEGVILGIVYAFTGVPHAILFGAFTAVAAMVPFAAAIAFGLAALAVLAAGKVVPAIIIVVAGFVTTFASDHFVRPSLIGGTTKLPFIWVLLGILGGVETFGLLGLFLGPAIMAALILLWRETAGEEAPGSAKAE